MAHRHQTAGRSAAPKASLAPYVEVTILFRDALQKPIEGLSVRVKSGAGARPAPAWTTGPDMGDDPVVAPEAGSRPAGASTPAATPPPQQMVNNRVEVTTNQDGYAVTIRNAARNQPIDIFVKNRHGEYVLKATITPKKDIGAFTVISPEYHLEATTKMTPKEELEQNLNLPAVIDGEVMTVERLVNEFGPYIGWSQKVTEQGKVKKDFPKRHREVTTDERTGKKKNYHNR